eukprot:299225-Amphidinium_carterae.1
MSCCLDLVLCVCFTSTARLLMPSTEQLTHHSTVPLQGPTRDMQDLRIRICLEVDCSSKHLKVRGFLHCKAHFEKLVVQLIQSIFMGASNSEYQATSWGL